LISWSEKAILNTKKGLVGWLAGEPAHWRTCALVNRLTRQGFTLVELLLTAGIFSVVSIAVYGTFNSGMNIWQRAENFNQEGRKRFLRLEKMKKELRGAFCFRKQELYFNGTKIQVQIPLIEDSQINKVTYRFDSAINTLLRSKDKLADILTAQEKNNTLISQELPFISEVEDFSFAYFYFDPQKSAYLWKDDWQEENLPRAVKINVNFRNETYSASVFIPSSG